MNDSKAGVPTHPHIGYTAATTIAQRALATGRTSPDLTTEMDILPTAQLRRLLQPEILANVADHTEDDGTGSTTVLPRE